VGKAPARSGGSPPHAKGGGSLLWLQGAACGIVLTFAAPAALLAGTLLAPAVMAWVAEREAGRPVARAVLLFGSAVAIGPVWHLVLSGDSMAAALEITSDPAILAFAWTAAAFAWALCEVLPVVVARLGQLAESARAAAWREELKALQEEWGDAEGTG
jgi:hypothetical protein